MALDEEEVLIRDDSVLLHDVNAGTSPRQNTWRSKMAKTACLSLAFFALGLCIAIPGPTLLDLGDQVNASTAQMMIVFASRSVGYLVGAVVGGVLFDCFDKQLLLFNTLLISSVATVAIPWSLTLVVMATMFALQGLTMGALDTGGNIFCVRIWGKKNGTYLQTIHFAFGIGAFIAPLLATPFLSNNASNNTQIIQGNIPVSPFLHNQINLTRNTRSEHQWLLHADKFSEFGDVFNRHRRDGDSESTSTSVTPDSLIITAVPVKSINASAKTSPVGTSKSTVAKNPDKTTSSTTSTSSSVSLQQKTTSSSSTKNGAEDADETDDETSDFPKSKRPKPGAATDDKLHDGFTDGDIKDQVNANTEKAAEETGAVEHVNGTQDNINTGSDDTKSTTKAPNSTKSLSGSGTSPIGSNSSRKHEENMAGGSTPTTQQKSNVTNNGTSEGGAVTPVTPVAASESTQRPTAKSVSTTNTTTANKITTTQKPSTTTPKQMPTTTTAKTTTTPQPTTTKLTTTTTTQKPTSTTKRTTTTTTQKPTTTKLTTTTIAQKPTTTTKLTTSTTTQKPTTAFHPTTGTPKPTMPPKPVTYSAGVPIVTRTEQPPNDSTGLTPRQPNATQEGGSTPASTNASTQSTVPSVVTSKPASTTVARVPEKPSTAGNIFESAMQAVKGMSKIQFAYMIIGMVLFVNAIMFLVLYCKGKRRFWTVPDQDEYSHVKSEGLCFQGTLVCFLGLFFFCYVGIEVTYGALVSSFAIEFNSWPKTQGATVAAIFWGSMAVGRGFSIFLARCMGPSIMLVIDLILMVIGGLVLSVGIYYYIKLLWLGTLILGLGMSSAFPAAISWAEKYFNLTGKATAVFIVGSALGQIIIPVVTGYLYEQDDGMDLMKATLGLSVIGLVIFLIMQCFAVKMRGGSNAVRDRNGFLPLEDEEEDNMEMDLVHFDKTELKRRNGRRTRGNAEYQVLISDLDDD